MKNEEIHSITSLDFAPLPVSAPGMPGPKKGNMEPTLGELQLR